jgi:hypothetical protein
MLSNPVSIYISGSEEFQFEYKPGNIAFHFSPYDNGLDSTMVDNLIFFADDEDSALKILRDMIWFVLEKSDIYLSNRHDDSRVEYRIKRYEKYLKALDDGNIKLTLVPRNKFYKVSWASNDTI